MQKYGGFIDWLTTPNMDIVENYAFLIKHIYSCQEESILVAFEERLPPDFEQEKNIDLKEYFPTLKILKQWRQVIREEIDERE